MRTIEACPRRILGQLRCLLWRSVLVGRVGPGPLSKDDNPATVVHSVKLKTKNPYEKPVSEFETGCQLTYVGEKTEV